MTSQLTIDRKSNPNPDVAFKKSFPRLVSRVGCKTAGVMVIVLALMTAYQLIKYSINPDISLVASNVVTVLFSTFLSGLASFFVIRNQHLSNRRLRREVARRRRVEDKLFRERADLEIRVAEKTAELANANHNLALEVTQRIHQSRHLMTANDELKNKILELNLLYDICRRRSVPRDVAQLLTDTVETLPKIWDDQLDVGVRITWSGLEFTSKGFRQSDIVHTQKIAFAQHQACAMEFSLPPGTSGQAARRAVAGKEKLLTSVADFMSKAIERKTSQNEKSSLEQQLRQSQKMEAIGTLAGGIAHDFNNVLAAIIGFTELSLEDAPRDGPIRNHLNQIHKAALRARDLVRHILSFSRRTENEKRPLDILPVVKETLQLLRAAIPTSVTINRRFGSDIDWVEADPTQIHQLMMNLCANASDAMKETGGELTVGLENASVDREQAECTTDLKVGQYVKLTVADAGPGVPDDIMDRIFDPFFTTKEVGCGTGMGLSVVHGVVQSHGGAVTVGRSQAGGALFTIYLPSVEAVGVAAAKPQSEILVGGSERILVVDDEESVAELIGLMLERLGYRPIIKTSSADALQTFLADPEAIDLVITDMTMPRMSGATLAKEILDCKPTTPIILCTGFSDQVNDNRANRIGIRRLLTKPTSMAEIGKAIREALAPDSPSDNEIDRPVSRARAEG